MQQRLAVTGTHNGQDMKSVIKSAITDLGRQFAAIDGPASIKSIKEDKHCAQPAVCATIKGTPSQEQKSWLANHAL